MTNRPSLLCRIVAHPVFMCGFRPFFLLTAIAAFAFMLGWLAFLGGWTALAGLALLPGGPVLWHGHEMIFGFGSAAIAGFVLTAIPEFTGTQPAPRQQLLMLVLLWLAARFAYVLALLWGPGGPGLWPAAVLNLLFWAGLMKYVLPPVWRDVSRRQLSFGWTLLTLMALQAGFFIALHVGGNPLAWLHATVGAMMVLIIVAASRISMSIMNRRVEAGRSGNDESGAIYLARPPRRKLAVFTIALCTLVEFVLGRNAITGWTALAASAAMLNLLNDWHVGRRLFNRWALMLYASYWLLALGYAAMGLAWLGAPLTLAAGRHVLMAGAMSLAILIVMNIAGRIHAGRWLDRRIWLPLAGGVLVMAAVLRLISGMGAMALHAPLLWLFSGGLWATVFAVYLYYAWPVLAGPRTDGREGCEGPVATPASRK